MRPRRTLVLWGASMSVIINSTKANSLPSRPTLRADTADSGVKSRLSTGRGQEINRRPERLPARGKSAYVRPEGGIEFHQATPFPSRCERARRPPAAPSYKGNRRPRIQWKRAVRFAAIELGAACGLGRQPECRDLSQRN